MDWDNDRDVHAMAYTKRDVATAYVEAISLMQEYGAWHTVACCIGWHERLIVDHGTEADIAALQVHKEKLAAAQAYEEVHGKGSLLQHSHPRYLKLAALVAKYRRSGSQALRPEPS